MALTIDKVATDPQINEVSQFLRATHHIGMLIVMLAPGQHPVVDLVGTVAAAAPHFRAPILGCKSALFAKKEQTTANSLSALFFGCYALRTALYIGEKIQGQPLGSITVQRLLPYLRASQLIALLQLDSNRETQTLDSLDLLVAFCGMEWTPIPSKLWVKHTVGLGVSSWMAHDFHQKAK